MNKEELKKHYIICDGHEFPPRYEYIEIKSEDGTIDFDYTITATAEEVYQEWLEQKDAPPQPTETEVLQQKVAVLETENLTLNEQTLDLDYRVVMLEIGI